MRALGGCAEPLERSAAVQGDRGPTADL